MITYKVPDNLDGKEHVMVTFENEKGEIFTKSVNIPKNQDGSIDEDYFKDILEGQLRGVENKVKVGAISFIQPGKETNSDDIPETIKNKS
jgi:hypothetical protein